MSRPIEELIFDRTQADIDNISCDRGYYSNYENVSKGKSYDTNAKKYTAAPDDGKSYGYNVVNADANSFWKEDSSRYCKYGSFNGNKWKSSLYCDDGIKLTDGEYGKTSFSKYDEWVSYSVSGDTKPYNVIIDLGSNKTSLTYFGMELNNHNEGGLKIFPRDA